MRRARDRAIDVDRRNVANPEHPRFAEHRPLQTPMDVKGAGETACRVASGALAAVPYATVYGVADAGRRSFPLRAVVSTARPQLSHLPCCRMKPGSPERLNATVRASSRLTSDPSARHASQYERGLSASSNSRMSEATLRADFFIQIPIWRKSLVSRGAANYHQTMAEHIRRRQPRTSEGFSTPSVERSRNPNEPGPYAHYGCGRNTRPGGLRSHSSGIRRRCSRLAALTKSAGRAPWAADRGVL
jgi:hypothetical protein